VPVITFLQDIFSIAKGPYHRKIGRHTQRFCRKAVKHSTNKVQQKMFLVAAICADELIATLLGLENKRQVNPFQNRTLKNKIAKQQVVRILHVYLSAILTLMSSQKDRLLQRIGMEEQKFLYIWCSIFEYLPSDMQMFNELMVPVYQQEGIDGLSILVGQNILEQLFVVNDVLSTSEVETLQKIIVEDAAAVVRFLQTDKAEASKIV
jgi:hypothetical protein